MENEMDTGIIYGGMSGLNPKPLNPKALNPSHENKPRLLKVRRYRVWLPEVLPSTKLPWGLLSQEV